MDDDAGIILADALKANKTVKVISMSFNRFTDASAEPLIDILKQSTTETILNLTSNNFSRHMKSALQDAGAKLTL